MANDSHKREKMSERGVHMEKHKKLTEAERGRDRDKRLDRHRDGTTQSWIFRAGRKMVNIHKPSLLQIMKLRQKKASASQKGI